MTPIAALAAEPSLPTETVPRPATDYANVLREDGLTKGIQVLTAEGWQRVERLVPGDRVMTFDNGPQAIVRIHTATISRSGLPAHKAFVMRVPAGALNNDAPLRLLASQEVLIESDVAEQATGDPFLLVPAVLLNGYRGVETEAIDDDVEVFMLTFRDEQIVQVEGGVLAACRAEADFSPFETAGKVQDDVRYPRLDSMQLQALVPSIVAE
jgi:hypothetical protein